MPDSKTFLPHALILIMKHLTLVLWCLFLCACTKDPSGSYLGDVTVVTDVRTLTEDFDTANGTGQARSTRGNDARSGVRVQLSSSGDERFELTLDDGCTVPLEALPGERTRLNIPYSEEPSCPLAVDGMDELAPFIISGTATLGSDAASLQLTLDGQFRRGDPDRAGFTTADWTLSFSGRRQSD